MSWDSPFLLKEKTMEITLWLPWFCCFYYYIMFPDETKSH